MMAKSPITATRPDRSIEDRRRYDLLEASNRAFAALKGRAEDWEEELEERAEWAATLSDELQNDDRAL